MVQNLFHRSIRFFHREGILQRVIFNSTWLLGSNTINAALAMTQAAIMSRVLGPANYGVLVLITGYILVIQQLFDSRVWEAAIKFIPQFREAGNDLKATATLKLFYYIDAVASVIILLTIIGTAEFAAKTFVKDSTMTDLIRFYALIVVIDFSTETSSALLRLNNRFDWLAYHSVAVGVLKTLGVLLASVMGASVEIMLVASIVTSTVGVLIMQIMAYQTMRHMNLANWRASPLKLISEDIHSVLGFIFSTNLTATSQLITGRVDVLILGWLGTPADAGIYELAKRVVNQVNSLFVSVNVTVYPEVSKSIARHQYREVISLQKRFTKLFATLCIPICVVVSIASIWIVPAIFGQDFNAMILLIQIMSWRLVWTAFVWFPGYMLSLGLARFYAALTATTAVVYTLSLAILVPTLGGLGAAIAFTMRFGIWVILASVFATRYNRRLLSAI